VVVVVVVIVVVVVVVVVVIVQELITPLFASSERNTKTILFKLRLSWYHYSRTKFCWVLRV